jgi:oxepin-CoA hydrolase/3-oxo-5,6-dehydrosuberyl-CoA semialdehyde dehydrogenase
MMEKNKKDFLQNDVPQLLSMLNSDREPNFGLMTPQHMVEHLTWVIKSSVKRYGEPEESPTDRQLGFKKFIENGAVFQHRPSKKTKADLPELKFGSMDEALEKIPEAISRFYNHFEANPGAKSYSPIMGELSFDELELFHYMHIRFHLWQFGLLESYP